jgi:hypothetical protein
MDIKAGIVFEEQFFREKVVHNLELMLSLMSSREKMENFMMFLVENTSEHIDKYSKDDELYVAPIQKTKYEQLLAVGRNYFYDVFVLWVLKEFETNYSFKNDDDKKDMYNDVKKVITIKNRYGMQVFAHYFVGRGVIYRGKMKHLNISFYTKIYKILAKNGEENLVFFNHFLLSINILSKSEIINFFNTKLDKYFAKISEVKEVKNMSLRDYDQSNDNHKLQY